MGALREDEATALKSNQSEIKIRKLLQKISKKDKFFEKI